MELFIVSYSQFETKCNIKQGHVCDLFQIRIYFLRHQVEIFPKASFLNIVQSNILYSAL